MGQAQHQVDQTMPNEQRARRIKAPLAFHEAGHAVIGWALGLHVIEIMVLDDRPGKAKIDGAERLPLVDQIAIYQVGHAAEESLGYLLPAWAIRRDAQCTVNLITAKEIRERLERARWIYEGRRRAKGLLEQHENMVHKVAAHLSRSRRLDADEFKSLMEAAG